MLLQIVVLLLIAGIVAFYAFVEGFYSATVMAVCCVLSAAVAFNFYEPLARDMARSIPKFADAVSLGLLFAVTLAALRVAADKLLGGMVHVPYVLDRIGGGVMGAITALIVIGTFVVCLRLLPFGPSLMGHEQVSGISPAGRIETQPLWLRPDGFTLGLIDMLSGGSLAGGNRLTDAHPDFIAENAGFNNFASGTAEPFAADVLSSVATTMPDGRVASGLAVGEYLKPEALALPGPLPEATLAKVKLLGVLVQPKSQEGEDGVILAPTQAQLTCRKQGPGGSAEQVVLAPVWLVDRPDWQAGKWARFTPDKAWRFKPDKGKPGTIGLLYVVPKDCEPAYLTVRKYTRTELTLPPAKPAAEQ